MTYVTILTGASRGIGAAIAEIYLNENASNNLIAVARSAPALEELAKKFGEDRVGIIVGDVSDASISSKAVELAIQKFGKINAIIANAGVLEPVQHVSIADISKWKKLFDINFFSVVSLISLALPELRKTKGNIVAVSSGASTKPYDAWGAYGSSKAALNHLISSVAAEEPEVNAISIAPGVVDTEMQDDIRNKFGVNMTSEALKRFTDLHTNSQLLTPDIPAKVYSNLALQGWEENLNGQYLRYDDEKLKKYSI